jgi:RNA polymerase sigma-70 factor (ECF subfamily)
MKPLLYFAHSGVLLDRGPNDVQQVSAVTRLFAQPSEAGRADPAVAAAFEAAWDEQLGALFAYVRYRVDSAQSAEELTSATFLRALERIRSFDPGRGDMRQWIFAIARHLVTDHLRARRRWILVPLDWLGTRSSSERTPEQAAADAEVQDRLLDAIGRLRRRQRDLLGMKFGAGLTNREIAAVTGLKEGHVAVLVQRALARLKTWLASEGVTHA